ncbi:MAG: V-type ATPase subunit [Cellulosilyticaceae bacterium]
MNPFASYKAINAKLHSRHKAFLSSQEWDKMLDYKTVSQVSEFLIKKYGYSEVIDSNQIKEMHRTELEVDLNHYCVVEIEKMLYYFSGSYKNFFKVLLMKFEIEDLLIILRAIARDEDRSELAKHFIHSEKHTKLQYNKLIECQNMTQFVELLKDTPYYEPLKTMTQEDALKREFHMEMKLNILYFKILMEKAKKLEPKDCRIVEQIIGFKIDYLNIQWIYRAIKYYDISREEILIYSLVGGQKITYNRLKKLAYTTSMQDFKRLAKQYFGEDLFDEDEDVFLEKKAEKLLYKLIKKEKGSENIGLPIAYIYSLNMEIKDLIAVAEGIRYGLPKEEIKKYLVYTIL